MKKDDLLSLLQDVGLLDRKPLDAAQVQSMMNDSFRIPHDSVLYVEMLEILLAVTLAYPFSEESIESSHEAVKINHVLKKVEVFYASDAEAFKKEIEDVRKQKSYIPRCLVPEPDIMNTSRREADADEDKGSEDAGAEDDEENEEADVA